MNKLTPKKRHFLEWIIAATSGKEPGLSKTSERMLLMILHTGEYEDAMGTALNEIMDVVKDRYVEYLKSDNCHTTITK